MQQAILTCKSAFVAWPVAICTKMLPADYFSWLFRRHVFSRRFVGALSRVNSQNRTTTRKLCSATLIEVATLQLR